MCLFVSSCCLEMMIEWFQAVGYTLCVWLHVCNLVPLITVYCHVGHLHFRLRYFSLRETLFHCLSMVSKAVCCPSYSNLQKCRWKKVGANTMCPSDTGVRQKVSLSPLRESWLWTVFKTVHLALQFLFLSICSHLWCARCSWFSDCVKSSVSKIYCGAC